MLSEGEDVTFQEGTPVGKAIESLGKEVSTWDWGEEITPAIALYLGPAMGRMNRSGAGENTAAPGVCCLILRMWGSLSGIKEG